jgi:phosphate ABC transporter phosphate-binding protein
MSPRRLRLRLFISALAAALALAVVPAGPASAANYVTLNGDGSSWAQPAIQQWTHDIASADGIQINYTGDGSAQGRAKYAADQNDFAGSDIAFLTQGDPFGAGKEASTWNYSYIPIVAGGTTFIYNLTVAGQKIKNLRLAGATIAGIFTGAITNWDAPQITHDYGAQLPNLPITVVTRADGSGASYMFTRWLSKQYANEWNSFCGSHGGPNPCGPTEFYPGFSNSVQKNGSDQMASFLASPISNGAIGYDEYAYALNYGLPAVKMLNAAGYYTLPTDSNVAIALQAAVIDENPNDVTFLMQNLDGVYTYSDPRAYPLSSYSYLIIPRDHGGGLNNQPPPSWTNDKGATLSTWLNYVLCGAQQSAGNLGYSPLPKNLVVGGFQQVDHMTGHVATPDTTQLNGCNNPTYSNGVNHLIVDAAMPSPCDKDTAPLNCTVVNGKAVGAGSGSGNNNGNNGNAANPNAAKQTATANSSPSVNPITGQQIQSNATSAAQNIQAEPVAVASRPDEEAFLSTLTVLEILAAISAPVVVGALVQRRRKRG